MLIVVGDARPDIPCRVEGNALMAASLRACGNEVVEYHSITNADHCGCCQYVAPLAHEFMEKR